MYVVVERKFEAREGGKERDEGSAFEGRRRVWLEKLITGEQQTLQDQDFEESMTRGRSGSIRSYKQQGHAWIEAFAIKYLVQRPCSETV